MVWNTIAHPKMMQNDGLGDVTIPEADTAIEDIKYADPHKLAFFDLLIDATDDDNPKLIHGDFETVKNKVLNHELVVGGEIVYSDSPDGTAPAVEITIGSSVQYMKLFNTIRLKIFWSNGNSITYTISSDNTVSSNSGAPFKPVNPGDR